MKDINTIFKEHYVITQEMLDASLKEENRILALKLDIALSTLKSIACFKIERDVWHVRDEVRETLKIIRGVK